MPSVLSFDSSQAGIDILFELKEQADYNFYFYHE